MAHLQRILASLFTVLIFLAFVHCARRGNPSGGPKDIDPPVLLRADPQNLTTEFTGNKIRLYFDEYIKLQDVQNQLIVSPPLKYIPEISPQGGASKFVEIILKDTLKENTTYTLNFGQSIVDNNEGNPSSYLTYVFSTGTYIDSLKLSGVVKDAFNRNADTFISVMLYEIDSTYTDSTIYRRPPNYITNTLDSTTIFHLQNLKEGMYSLIAIKDAGKNNQFDQKTDKIGFLTDTIKLPTDTTYLLTLFKEIPDYSVPPPTFAAANKIIFGYSGNYEDMLIEPLTSIPDTVRTMIAKEPEKDTLNYWFTPFETDSIVFKIMNNRLQRIDSFTVKTRKLAEDSLQIKASHRSRINFQDQFYITANIPIISSDTSKISIIDLDSMAVSFTATLDSTKNRLNIDFEKEAEQNYTIVMLPEAFSDFFENTNDTLGYRISTGGYADYGNLRLALNGALTYPLILQLTDEKGNTKREIYAERPQAFEFSTLDPAEYLIRIIFDANENRQWDTGNYLKKIQPEKVFYYPQLIEVRANWDLEQTINISG